MTQIVRQSGETTFLGYETTADGSKVVAILRDGTEYQELQARPEAELRTDADAEAEIVLDQHAVLRRGRRPGRRSRRVARRTRAAERSLFTVDDTQRPVPAA